MKSFTACVFLVAVPGLSAFVSPSCGAGHHRASRLFIDKRIADLIDSEVHRQHHKKEYEKEWMEKNRGAVLHSLHAGENTLAIVSDLEEQHDRMRQFAKDKRLAKDDPRRYCADRCISTGNCDVYEDIFDFSPTEVLKFCNDCVLGDGEEPCDIPDSFYDNLAP